VIDPLAITRSSLDELIAQYQRPRIAARIGPPASGPEPNDGQCEAMASCFNVATITERCSAAGTNRSDGRCLCWTHEQARNNPARSKPLQYVERRSA